MVRVLRTARPAHGAIKLKSCLIAFAAFGLAACNEEEMAAEVPGATPTEAAAPAPVPSPGSPAVTPPPSAPPVNAGGSSVDMPDTDEDAARFLTQSTFGPTDASISAVRQEGYSAWIQRQLQAPQSFYTARVVARSLVEEKSSRLVSAASQAFWESAVVGDDQLRQRMTYALSQIVVASDAAGSPLQNRPTALAYYMDILSQNALGNYRDLLEEVTYSPAMGLYLTYLGNRKGDPENGRLPDENYAREIMQLFSIGLLELNPDGTPQSGNIETYTNEDIVGLARVFTGLGYKGDRTRLNRADDDALYSPMAIYPEEHSQLEKSFLGVTIPANTGAEESIDFALDTLFAHPNVAPFISRQLIQRLVTSAPSPAYVQRVASAFENGVYTLPNGDAIGDGRRGDLAATAAAILLDTEARQDVDAAPATFGKVREPVLRFLHWARAFELRSARAEEDGLLPAMERPDRLGQHPFRAPSVFNFFRPGFVAPNSATSGSGLVAPELQIENEASAVGYANIMSRYVRDKTPEISGTSGDAFAPTFSAELPLADDVDALIDRLDLLLTYGRLTPETRERIRTILEAMEIRENSAEQDRDARVRMAVQLVVTSTEFMTQI